jgi:hypothetical protein
MILAYFGEAAVSSDFRFYMSGTLKLSIFLNCTKKVVQN